MNTQALIQATKEKEMINLITELIKYRQQKGRDKFLNIIAQMKELIEINEDIDSNENKELPHIQ